MDKTWRAEVYTPAFSPTLAFAQTRYHVRSDAQGTGSGLTWTNAFTEVQAALAVAQSGDEVWVAEGTYRPTAGTDRHISFEPASGVRLVGGFAGTETAVAQRDWTTHPVILTGDIGIAGDSTDNTLNVLYLFEPDSTTLIDGFTIRDGQADLYDEALYVYSREICGGGIYIDGYNGDAYPGIKNCTVIHNTAGKNGGGVMVSGNGPGSSVGPVFAYCIFEYNRALSAGGGLYRNGGSVAERGKELYNCDFRYNVAVNGGGLYFRDANGLDSVLIASCQFEYNRASNFGGGAYFYPARPGVMTLQVDSCLFKGNIAKQASALDIFPLGGDFKGTVTLTNSVFTENKAIPSGGYVYRIDMFGDDESIYSISHCIFNENISGPGGSLNNGDGKLFFTDNIMKEKNPYFVAGDFLQVVIDRMTGGISNNAPTIMPYFSFFLIGVPDSLLIQNSIFDAGAYTIETYLVTSAINKGYINNCTFSAQNTLFNGGSFGLFANSTTANLHIANSCITNKLVNQSFATFHLSHCYLLNFDCANPSNGTICDGPVYSGFDPLFMNPDSGDYRLQPCSPLINAGTNSVIEPGETDIDGNPRIQGARVDIGAYESAPLSLNAEPATLSACPGGSNGSVSMLIQTICEPVVYAWSGPGGSSGQSLVNLAAGAYSLTISDAKNDTLLVDFVIPEAPATVEVQTTPVICGGTTGGSAAVNLAGIPASSYLWNDGTTDSLRNQLAFGVYTVTITGTNGCTGVGMASISRIGSIQFEMSEASILCHSDTNGALTVTPLDGLSPYQWLWFDGSTQASVENLGAGQYTGKLTDALGCVVNWVFPLEEPDTIIISYSTQDATAATAADGSILLQPTGGSGSFSAEWSNGMNGLNINGLLPGVYTATITDGNGCVQVQTVEVQWSVGTGEPQVSAFKVWPNPVHEWLSVQPSSEMGPWQFVITDALGCEVRRISRPDGSGFSVWVGDLPAGGYVWMAGGCAARFTIF